MKLILPSSNCAKPSIPAIWQMMEAMATAALYDELYLENKPGLVCPSSQGSHSDMDYHTFETSITSLGGYFGLMCQHGYHNSTFEQLKLAGIEQEAIMRKATHNINTHKGAIFNFGFVCASIGQCVRQSIPLSTANICQQIIQRWRYDLLHHLPRQPNSHGQKMYQTYGLTGAIELVANGFEIIQQTALPCFESTYTITQDFEKSALQTLMTLIATVSDTNLAWRGGMAGLQLAQQLAKDFLDADGVFSGDWRERATDINRIFIKNNLSPGGCADLLGVTFLFFRIEHECHYFI